MPPKLVLDANIIVSAFFWDGNEAELFRKIEQEKSLFFISQEILQEVEQVINRPKFKQAMVTANATQDQLIQKIISLAHFVIGPKLNIKACRDPQDNKVLECAVHAKADYIVSGDEDLLMLKNFRGIPVIKTSLILRLLR